MIHLQFSWSYCHLVEDQGALFTQQKDKEKVSDSCWQCYKIHMQTLTSNSIVNYLLISKKLGKIASQIFAVTDEKKKKFSYSHVHEWAYSMRDIKTTARCTKFI